MAASTVTTEGAGRFVSMPIIDRLGEKAAKLSALIHNTYGGSGESFRNMNDELQDNYLWTCAGLADELAALVAEI